jgi:hypothetical protein
MMVQFLGAIFSQGMQQQDVAALCAAVKNVVWAVG